MADRNAPARLARRAALYRAPARRCSAVGAPTCPRRHRDHQATLEELKDLGVGLHMIDLGGDVTGNGISKLIFTILSAVAENERDRIRERIRDVKRPSNSTCLSSAGGHHNRLALIETHYPRIGVIQPFAIAIASAAHRVQFTNHPSVGVGKSLA